jgi:hypothetical protein
LAIVNQTLASATAPAEWQQTSLTVIPKSKGNLEIEKSWRGISLTSCAARLYNRLLLNRLRGVIEPHLLPGQAAYRPGRNTVQNVWALRQLIDIAKERTMPLHLLFVDFSAAFDSVSWKALQRIMEAWGVPTILTQAVWSIVKDHQVSVQLCPSPTIPLTQGVLQGDTLAPFLFILIIDALLRKLPKVGIRVGGDVIPQPPQAMPPRTHTYNLRPPPEPKGEILNNLAYADDIALAAHSSEDLQSLYSSLEANALAVGLRVNLGPGKTERMVWNTPPSIVLTATASPIPVVTDYKYLGVHVQNFKSEFAIRRSRAWAALRELRGVWTSSAPHSVKRQLAVALIVPILTYGLDCWPLTVSDRRQLRSTYSRMLRAALNVAVLGYAPSGYPVYELRTEQLHGDTLTLPASVTRQRLERLGHLIRAHFDERRDATHLLVDIFLWEPPWPRKRGGQPMTLRKSILRALHCDEVGDVADLALRKVQYRNRVRDAVEAEEWNQYAELEELRAAALLDRGDGVANARQRVAAAFGAGTP